MQMLSNTNTVSDNMRSSVGQFGPSWRELFEKNYNNIIKVSDNINHVLILNKNIK